jgi:hypothetical protein
MATTRADVARLLGPATDQIGSVNEPRTTEEHGVRWNEKWIYRDRGDEGGDRVVLFHRYDFLGVWRIAADGTARAEPLPQA